MKILNKGELLTTEQIYRIVELLHIDIDIYIFKTKIDYLKYLIKHPSIFLIPLFTTKISAFFVGSICPNIKPCKINFLEYAHKKDRNITCSEQLEIMMVFILLHEMKHYEQYKEIGLLRMAINRRQCECEANEYAKKTLQKHLKEFSSILGYEIEELKFEII